MRAKDVIGHLRESVLLALSLLQGERNDEIVVLSDGTETEWQAEVPAGVKITPMQVQGGEQNVGITQFAFRKGWGETSRYEMMLTVHNFTPASITVPLKVTINRRRLLRKEITLQGDEVRVLVFPFTQELRGVVEARLLVEDDFPLDNVARTVLTQARSFWVLLVSPGNYFLENLLSAHPYALVNMIDRVEPSAFAQQVRGHHIVIFDRITPPPLRAGNFFLINTLAPNLPIQGRGEVAEPQIIDWQKMHPILRQVQLDHLTIRKAQQVSLQPGAQSLIEADTTSLLTVVQNDKLRLVHLGFDLFDSDLPMRVAFPLLLENIFQWLYPGMATFGARQVEVGKPYTLPLEGAVQQVTVRKPGGKRMRIPVSNKLLSFQETDEVGLYTVRVRNRAERFAVNLLSEQESRILPRKPLSAASLHATREGLFTEERVRKPVWFYFVFAALLLTVGEWYCWCRGS